MTLQVGRYGGQCPSKPLSRSDKFQLWAVAAALLYLAVTLCLVIREAFLLWAVGG